MNLLANWFTPETVKLVALALLHFLWQGVALAALGYVAFSLCRSASMRYAVGVATLAVMFAAPVITFLALRAQQSASDSPGASTVSTASPAAGVRTVAAAPHKSPALPAQTSPEYLLWLVELWFVGVMIFSLRSAGGFLLVERLLRKQSTPISDELLELAVALQDKMGIARMVRYCKSIHVDAPTVAGWLRPVVLLPVTSLTGLNEEQIRAILAHELAHIKRYDAFVNLFQVAVETLLFYHPAVWWIGKRIREERENCCDDAAVAFCGSPLTYAQALAQLAESRVAPQMAMAANRGPLAVRVARLLGVGNTTKAIRGANLSLGVLCLSAALFAGSSFIGVARAVHAQSPAAPAPPAEARPATPSAAPRPAAAPATPIPVRPANPAGAPEVVYTPKAPLAPMSALAPISAAARAPLAAPIPEIRPAIALAPRFAFHYQAGSDPGPQKTGPSYIDGLHAAGLNDLTVDQIIELKVQDVSPEYIKQMRDLGLKTDADTLVGMKVQGITPDYVREMRSATNEKLDADQIIGMKVQGVTPAYFKQMQDLGFKMDADDVISMKVQGVTPEYVQQMRALGLKLDADTTIGMKVQGITPDYVKSINELGLHPDADELIGMKVQGIDAAYFKSMQAAGFKLNVDDAISAKVQGITPEFIQKVRSHGFKDLTIEQLLGLKMSGALDAQ